MEQATGAGYEQRIGAARGAFASIARVWSDDELLTAAKQVAEVLESPGWARMAGLIQARADVTTAQMTHGPIIEQAKYAAMSGLIQGYEVSALVGEVILAVAQEREDSIRAKQREE